MSAFDYVALGVPDFIVAVTAATEIPPDAPIEEFKAVMDVMRNRVKSPHFPDTPVEVVLQRNQFSAVCREKYWFDALNGKWLPKHVEKCYNLWIQGGEDTTDGAVYYYSPISMNPPNSKPKWNFTHLEETSPKGVRKNYFRFYKEKR